VVDWDGDGRKDLIVGERNGHIRIYLNTNTDSDPGFSGYTLVQEGSRDFDCGYNATPFIVDWNNDGRKDLLCGEESGRVYLLLNTGTNSAPLFADTLFLQDGGNSLDANSRTAPAVCDWNNDGKKDLLVGESAGRIFYFENQGTDSAPLFDGSVLLQAEGVNIDVERYSRFDVSDWDNDGVADLIVGNHQSDAPRGRVWFFHALGPLSVDENDLSESSGGVLHFALNGGVQNSGRQYFLLASAAGTEPGYTLPGGSVLPLNLNDSLFRYFENPHVFHPVFGGFRGTLDSSGRAAETMVVNSVPIMAGTILHFAWTTEVPYDFQSNVIPVEIVP
jgi:hypothetical protein